MKKCLYIIIFLSMLILSACDNVSNIANDTYFEDLVPKDGTVDLLENDPEHLLVTKTYIIKDSSDEIIYYVYEASTENTYGALTIYMIIDQENKIIDCNYVENKQAIKNEHTQNVLSKHIGDQLDEIELLSDFNTGVTMSIQSANQLITAIINKHKE